MARTVNDQRLSSRAARAALKPSDKPYYRAIDEGLHLGYRKGRRGGKWVVRRYLGDARYSVETLDGVVADDVRDANGANVLNFSQARARARELHTGRGVTEMGVPAEPFTVAAALDSYIAKLEDEGKPAAHDARCRAEALIKPALGNLELAALKAELLRAFLNDQARAAARLRTAKGEKQRHRPRAATEEQKRARRSNANRTWAVLRAALNHAFGDGKVANDAAWRRVKPFKGADSARSRWLNVLESRRLINAATEDFRELITAALLTGCRYSELARLDVGDFDHDAGTMTVRLSKSGKARHVFLTKEGRQFFARLCAGRAVAAPMLRRRNGKRWGPNDQARPMRAACTAARLAPPASFHALRHTYASLAVMNGAPLNVVAHNLGHADARMVHRHYGHLAPSYIVEMIRETAPRFGIKANGKVISLGRKQNT